MALYRDGFCARHALVEGEKHPMKLWLDDVREPWKFGCLNWAWAKTYEEAIDMFLTGEVEEASLDHDLGLPSCQDCLKAAKTEKEYGDVLQFGCPHGEKTGYDVVCWLEQHPEYWPKVKVKVHSANPSGANRMRQVINRWYEGEGTICRN